MNNQEWTIDLPVCICIEKLKKNTYKTSEWNVDLPQTWEGGKERNNPWKLALRALTRIKTHGNVPANLPEVPQISKAKPMHWFGFKFFLNHRYPH